LGRLLQLEEVADRVPLVEQEGANIGLINNKEDCNILHEYWWDDSLPWHLEKESLLLLDLLDISLVCWSLSCDGVEVRGDAEDLEADTVRQLDKELAAPAPPVNLVSTQVLNSSLSSSRVSRSQARGRQLVELHLVMVLIVDQVAAENVPLLTFKHTRGQISLSSDS